MPELPEVQTVVSTLAPRLTGRMIRRVRHLRADIVSPAGFDLRRSLARRTIRSIERRGKRIVFTLDDGNRLYIHLGMSGRLTVESTSAPVMPHTHLIVDVGDRRQLRFRDPRRFGGIWWLGREDFNGQIGPEPLGLRTATLARRLSKTTRAIKNALLDQRVVAGLGNIYVDESLFAARIHPLTPARALIPTQIARLNRAIKATLKRAIRHRGSTLRDYVDADGAAGKFQSLHRVYAREGRPCIACRSPIERIVLGGRSTHFCPVCQAMQRRGKSA
jgi:formamidopyrimidine-DNA glycosylase